MMVFPLRSSGKLVHLQSATHVHVYIYMYTYTYACTRTRVHIYIYIWAHPYLGSPTFFVMPSDSVITTRLGYNIYTYMCVCVRNCS